MIKLQEIVDRTRNLLHPLLSLLLTIPAAWCKLLTSKYQILLILTITLILFLQWLNFSGGLKPMKTGLKTPYAFTAQSWKLPRVVAV